MRDLHDLEMDAFLAQGELLAQLAALPAWEAYTTLLHDMRQAALEQLANERDPSELRYWQGVAGALGEILDRPGRIITAAADFQRDEEAEKPGTLHTELRAAIGLGVDHEGEI